MRFFLAGWLILVSSSRLVTAFVTGKNRKTGSASTVSALPDLPEIPSDLPSDVAEVSSKVAGKAPYLADFMKQPPGLNQLSLPPTTAAESQAKLALLKQNAESFASSVLDFNNWQNFVSYTVATLQLEQYGAWYAAAFCLFLGAAQRQAGRDEAKAYLVEKIVKGEIDPEKMVEEIKEAQEAEARAIAEREAEIKRREEEAAAKRAAAEKAKADALEARQAKLEEARQKREAAKQAVLAEKQRVIDELRAAQEEKRRAIRAKQLEAEAKRLAVKEEKLKKIEERRLAAEEKRRAAEEKKLAAARARTLAIEERRLKVEQQKLAVAEAKRKQTEERQAALDATRKEKEEKRLAAVEAKRLAVEERRLKVEEQKLALEEAERLKAEEEEAKQAQKEEKKLAATDAEELAAVDAKLREVEEEKQAIAEARNLKSELEAAVAEAKGKDAAAKSPTKAKAKTAPEKAPKQKSKAPKKKAKHSSKTTVKAKAPKSAKKVIASPLAVVLARERGIDISIVPGTGSRGRVLADDVKNFQVPDEATVSHNTEPAEVDEGDFFFAQSKGGDSLESDTPSKKVVKSSSINGGEGGKKQGEDWASLSPSTLKRKTNKQLADYLTERGASVTDASGNPLKKADLVQAVFDLSTTKTA